MDTSFGHSLPPLPNGGAAVVQAEQPGNFIDEHIYPLFINRTVARTGPDGASILTEAHFWDEHGVTIFGAVRLRQFRLSDWFPRTPGVYWSRYADTARVAVFVEYSKNGIGRNGRYTPTTKRALVEEGGLGTIRLRPRRIDGEDCWLATAVSGTECHRGIPLAIPNTLLRKADVRWGDRVNIGGRVRLLHDAGLNDTAYSVHHAQPLIVFVDELEGIATPAWTQPISITPVALFVKKKELHDDEIQQDSDPLYTFVTCDAGSNSAIDDAAEWIEKYAAMHEGRIVTNFDEQRPVLAEAPLSYQRLVAKTYDRRIIPHFNGYFNVKHIDQLVQGPVMSQEIGEIRMGHNINVGGAAIINIDSVFSNVTQTIGSSPGLDPAQKVQLETLVQSLKTELDKLQTSHPEETKEIASALEKAVASAAKPPEQRKPSILQLSASGLKEAAELVKDIAPTVLTTAGLIAKFIVGL